MAHVTPLPLLYLYFLIDVPDYIDVVKDTISSGDYRREEDPTVFVSEKTGRGPLGEDWREEYGRAAKDPHSGKRVMCAYKLCKVEFRYWGMQSKIERFIHDVGESRCRIRSGVWKRIVEVPSYNLFIIKQLSLSLHQ